MTETLQEFCDSRGVAIQVDRQAGVIRGVKVLGLESRNGRTYLPDALVAAAPLYEEAKVNVNHPKGNPAGPRDYQDRIGVIRNVAVRPAEGLFADFHFNPKHALAEQLLWDAEHAPENVGFSHNVEARTSRLGERTTVEAITRVQSVDLVADPATTRGLFESIGRSAETNQVAPAADGLTVETLKRDYPALVESLCTEQAEEVRRLRGEIERRAAGELLEGRRNAARRILQEAQLPTPGSSEPLARVITSEAFFDALAACSDEGAMRTLVEDRRRLVQAISGNGLAGGWREDRPQSRDPLLLAAACPGDAKSFVESIT